MPAGFTAADFYYILPEILLTAGALLVLVIDVLFPKGGPRHPGRGAGDAGGDRGRRARVRRRRYHGVGRPARD